jgi:hypothetical protein
MIHIKELRFGNKVQTLDGEVVTIQQILYNSIICEMQVDPESESVNVGKSFGSDYTLQLTEIIKELDYQEIFPIALNTEILKKCGLRNFLREEWIISIKNSHIDFEFIDNTLKLRCPAPALTNIKHLHQLQNLLFDIAAHEVEIEL